MCTPNKKEQIQTKAHKSITHADKNTNEKFPKIHKNILLFLIFWFISFQIILQITINELVHLSWLLCMFHCIPVVRHIRHITSHKSIADVTQSNGFYDWTIFHLYHLHTWYFMIVSSSCAASLDHYLLLVHLTIHIDYYSLYINFFIILH